QFAIREAGLYRPVLELAAETAAAWPKRPLVMIAGAIGKTRQAIAEARLARGMGYHAALLRLGGLRGASEDELIEDCQSVARELAQRALPRCQRGAQSRTSGGHRSHHRRLPGAQRRRLRARQSRTLARLRQQGRCACWRRAGLRRRPQVAAAC